MRIEKTAPFRANVNWVTRERCHVLNDAIMIIVWKGDEKVIITKTSVRINKMQRVSRKGPQCPSVYLSILITVSDNETTIMKFG